MSQTKLLILLFLISLLSSTRAEADPNFEEVQEVIPERRENVAKNQEGFFAFPLYTHVPGIGSTFGAGFLKSKIFGTRANALGAATFGDSNLIAAGFTEIYAIEKRLFFNVYAYSTKIPFQLYERGSGSSPDAYANLLRKEYGISGEGNLYFWNRRFEINAMIAPSRLKIDSVASPDGSRFTNSDRTEVDTLGATVRMQVDLTDDDQDPRRGVKGQLLYHSSAFFDDLHSLYGSLNGFITGYIPVANQGTLALHVFRSGSFLINEDTKSEAELRTRLSLNCQSIADPAEKAECELAENRRVQERVAENRYGTAALLGGPTQLRGFPIGRFRGSQSIMYAAEYRQNIGEENVPFDYGFIRGVRQLFQVAPFLEFGAATDPPESVLKAPLQVAYGLGFRLGFSGTLLRADVGFSKEGPQFTFFFGYPWDISIL